MFMQPQHEVLLAPVGKFFSAHTRRGALSVPCGAWPAISWEALAKAAAALPER